MTAVLLVDKTMSSREIADLVEKRHDNVKRTIETLVARGIIQSPQSEEISTATKPVTEYRVGKRDSYVIVAQLSPEFTARLVDRWQELEAQAAPALNPANLSRLQLIEMAMQAEQERLVIELQNTVLEHKVESLTPKAEALARISASTEAVTITQAAKLLGVKREKLTIWMHANGWIYRQNDAWVAYDRHIKCGRLQYKEARYTDDKTGLECHKPYCHVMPKGLAELAEVFVKEEMAVANGATKGEAPVLAGAEASS